MVYPNQFCHLCQPEENHQQEEHFLTKLTNLNFMMKSKIFHKLTTVSAQKMDINCNFTQERRYFIKQKVCCVNDIPIVTEVIVITESLNVKLFWKAIPVPLLEWFRKGSDRRLKNKSTLENFPSYIRSFVEKKH